MTLGRNNLFFSGPGYNIGYEGRPATGFFDKGYQEMTKERLRQSFGGDSVDLNEEERMASQQAEFEEMVQRLVGAIKEYENATAPSDQARLNYYLKLFSRLGTADRGWEKRSVLADIKRAVGEHKPPISSAPSRGLMGISSGPKGF